MILIISWKGPPIIVWYCNDFSYKLPSQRKKVWDYRELLGTRILLGHGNLTLVIKWLTISQSGAEFCDGPSLSTDATKIRNLVLHATQTWRAVARGGRHSHIFLARREARLVPSFIILISPGNQTNISLSLSRRHWHIFLARREAGFPWQPNEPSIHLSFHFFSNSVSPLN